MNEIIIKDDIENMIYEIRGKQVMLDSDVANLYNIETKRVNEVVKRNLNRFSDEFCFKISMDEWMKIKYQKKKYSDCYKVANCDLINEQGKHSKYLPYVFTEYGIMMLSGLLKSEIAVEVNKKIIKAFVNMRKYIHNSEKILLNIETKLIEHDNKFDEVFSRLETKEKINNIFFEGEIYDAYSLLIDIFSIAKKEIIIIDNYAGKELFDILKNIKVSIKIITKNIDEILIKKYKKQYNNIEIIKSDKFHDRFIIIDKNILYHSGASFKDLGNKCFSINKIEDKEYLKRLIESVNEIYIRL